VVRGSQLITTSTQRQGSRFVFRMTYAVESELLVFHATRDQGQKTEDCTVVNARLVSLGPVVLLA